MANTAHSILKGQCGKEPSSALLIAGIALIAILAETLVMFFFQNVLRGLPAWTENLMDAFLSTAMNSALCSGRMLRPVSRTVCYRAF